MIVCCAIIEQGGKILLALRNPQQKFGNHWEFPGGKMEPGESPEVCIQREIQEELCIGIHVSRRLPEFPLGETGTLVPFVCEIITGEIRLVEHQAIEWVRPEKLLDYTLSPADVALAEYIMAYHF
jgi:8-oxo-dGTP diphosphatase